MPHGGVKMASFRPRKKPPIPVYRQRQAAEEGKGGRPNAQHEQDDHVQERPPKKATKASTRARARAKASRTLGGSANGTTAPRTRNTRLVQEEREPERRDLSFKPMPEFKFEIFVDAPLCGTNTVWIKASELPDRPRNVPGDKVKVAPLVGEPGKPLMSVPWSPAEFVMEAVKIGHPSHLNLGVPPFVKHAVQSAAQHSC